ncbi:MliC family protein [Pectobacteriaceae bacterium CE70]|uniref:Lysozyme inhibitor n=1 Tax=Serratia sp. (strain ATCC 39006) TaxID=104623 RepID=A0A2I5T7H4_SERS3|nr:MliC family protein [Serratia sp. ATCC 39006]WJV60798.1 MliC family protein [Pectobacteriaceae bacterium C52]WJV68757.1 MliC family protein [Pectobacteriaceae bacterium CE70]WJY12683.1 MliC family protein [Pectobacteriaceae bacterium C80]AUH00518.1 lysozyme inhibitor [Serratia sp. ATCC 39006]AUH04838.1 lysozyme inhibitor [Serratia sp. ATCC 39006]
MKHLLTGGALLLLSGCSQWIGEQEHTLHYQCGTMPLTVTMIEQPRQSHVTFLLDGELHTLQQTPSASGVRYSDGKYTFWSKGNHAFIQRGSNIIVNDCILK